MIVPSVRRQRFLAYPTSKRQFVTAPELPELIDEVSLEVEVGMDGAVVLDT